MRQRASSRGALDGEIFRAKFRRRRLSADEVKLFIRRQISESPMRLGKPGVETSASIQISRCMAHLVSFIPIALDECVEAGRISPGDLVLLASLAVVSPGVEC